MTEADRIRDPDQWPCWPVLPMIRRGELMPEAAFLISKALKGKLPTPITLYLGNVWALKPGVLDVKGIPTKEYATVEDLLKDGWEVD